MFLIQKDLNWGQHHYIEILKDYDLYILNHLGKAYVVEDAFSLKVVSITNIVFLSIVDQPKALYIYSLAN